MVLGKLPVPGRPTIWITVGQGPTALAVGAGGGCLDIFTLIYPFSPLSPSLWETARYRLKYCLKGPFNPKPTNQPTNELGLMDFENGRSKRRLSNSSNASTDHDRGAKKGKTLDDSLSSLISPLSDEERSDGSFIRVTKGNQKSHREGGAAGGTLG